MGRRQRREDSVQLRQRPVDSVKLRQRRDEGVGRRQRLVDSVGRRQRPVDSVGRRQRPVDSVQRQRPVDSADRRQQREDCHRRTPGGAVRRATGDQRRRMAVAQLDTTACCFGQGWWSRTYWAGLSLWPGDGGHALTGQACRCDQGMVVTYLLGMI